ncbi:putative F-box/FBD/LRR-repeat protein At1g78760 [Trifolium pratense]|uniref:putative F-box/FBD/LRR-repeat protein At1g78760 n=1 Tax=Trifolium pratense TaxID=57577 RepID=UPI001E697183|nr:putative F-box/FBD/LRR-repeat protein At1g78760 [Trifolium pratense]
MSLKAQKRRRKRERQKERKKDRLSGLPDDLLLHIMQFMITKHCVQTCVLSKRWKNLWKYLTNIKLHFISESNSVLIDEFVSQFLSCRDNSVPLHSISYKNYEIPPKTTNILVEIMEYAASHNVQQLVINTETIELSPSIFNCCSLTSLTLCLRDAYKPSTTKMFPKSLNLPALKTLKLEHFTFLTSDSGYADPFSTCNMLSKLAIFSCGLQDDAQGLCISNSEVSNLEIGTFKPHYYKIHKIILCTPKLTSLAINGDRPTFPAPSTCNLTLLEELKFDCWFGYTMGEGILISWLHLLAKVQIITLNHGILDFMVNALKNSGSMRAQLPSFVKLKSLQLESHRWISDERAREMDDAQDLCISNSKVSNLVIGTCTSIPCSKFKDRKGI